MPESALTNNRYNVKQTSSVSVFVRRKAMKKSQLIGLGQLCILQEARAPGILFCKMVSMARGGYWVSRNSFLASFLRLDAKIYVGTMPWIIKENNVHK